jgi:hypothetical protein
MKRIQIGTHFAAVTETKNENNERVVSVTRTSLITNQIHTLPIHGVGFYSVVDWLTKRHAGKPHELVQDAFPLITADEREFLVTGITAEEWKTYFATRDEDDE